jgi:hypothetical protein
MTTFEEAQILDENWIVLLNCGHVLVIAPSSATSSLELTMMILEQTWAQRLAVSVHVF